MVGKTIDARIRQGRIEPVEPVELPAEGTEVVVTLEEAAAANKWFRDIHAMFAQVREELGRECVDRPRVVFDFRFPQECLAELAG